MPKLEFGPVEVNGVPLEALASSVGFPFDIATLQFAAGATRGDDLQPSQASSRYDSSNAERWTGLVPQVASSAHELRTSTHGGPSGRR